MQFLPPSRAIAHFGSANCPAAYQGLKIITSLSLRFPDFQRLQQAGSDRENILSATIYIKDMQDFASMNKVWDAWVVEDHSPARACVQASLARAELLVEISVVAAVNK